MRAGTTRESTIRLKALGPGVAPGTYFEVSLNDLLEQLGSLNIASRPARNKHKVSCKDPDCNGVGRKFIVKSDNPNGNAGRPYYNCSKCREWIGWDDEKGLSENNPLCDCDVPSRQGMKGIRTGEYGMGFWKCASGECDYYSDDKDGRSVWHGEVGKDQVERFAASF